jgi:ribosomal-protein-alanine N-acetyltransferase
VVIERCAFATERLDVDEWHRASGGADLAKVVAATLTTAVTDPLPPGWQGQYDEARARHWVTERDAEGTTLLVTEGASAAPIGLVLLFEEPSGDGRFVDVRLGYLLAEHAWGRGLGGKLLSGLVGWCSAHEVRRLIGGVAPDNLASMRMLERAGFERAAVEPPGGELEFRLFVDGHGGSAQGGW